MAERVCCWRGCWRLTVGLVETWCLVRGWKCRGAMVAKSGLLHGPRYFNSKATGIRVACNVGSEKTAVSVLETASLRDGRVGGGLNLPRSMLPVLNLPLGLVLPVGTSSSIHCRLLVGIARTRNSMKQCCAACSCPNTILPMWQGVLVGECVASGLCGHRSCRAATPTILVR